MLIPVGLVTIVCLQLIFATSFVHVEGRTGFGGTSQEWGYVTVRPYAKMFWWLYHTTSKNVADPRDKPLLIWLQGGPGASSTGYGNFEEFGPLDLDLKSRNYTWVTDYNVLFIDNPVGAGFSYGEKFSAYAKDNAQIASDLLECMKGFYEELPKWLSVPVYVTSESYGGKMAAEFALLWDREQKAEKMKSNFRGVVLIDSWISPIDSVLSWGSFLLQTGMVDTAGFEEIERAAMETKLAVENEQWSDATGLWSRTERVILGVTRNINFYNILYDSRWSGMRRSSHLFKSILPGRKMARDDRDDRLDSLMNNEVRKVLGIDPDVVWGSQSQLVFSVLVGDFMKPVTDTEIMRPKDSKIDQFCMSAIKNSVERLLNETDIEVFVISGQLDLIVATPGTVVWVENLKWRNSTSWHSAPRDPLVVDNVIEGYVKQSRNLKMYWVNRSGHMVPRDNPAAMAAILKSLTATSN